jgi:hypothetical protein
VRVEGGELMEAHLDLEQTEQVQERIRQKRALLLERMARGRRKD